ncbi:MAG: hypothetical protein AXA67_13730 [Methylothermaceae bacteria B42]|nr:MAG: hypothetical protein AXA67_13730 [Methylothermaceae bacteria B42]HHJ38313.1 hypothetical protein [Methylothermaceae bacterium]
MITRFLKFFAWFAFTALSIITSLFFLLFSSKPIVTKSKFTFQEKNHPRIATLLGNQPAGIITIDETTLAKALHSFLNQQGISNQTRVLITPNHIKLDTTLNLSSLRPYLNVKILLKPHKKRLKLASLTVGSLPLPPVLLEEAMLWTANQAPTGNLIASISTTPIQLDNRFLVISAERNNALAKAGSGSFLKALDDPRLIPYCRVTSRWSHTSEDRELSSYLQFLFNRAYHHTALKDAVRENKALLQVAAAYVNGYDPCQLFGIRNASAPPKKKTLLVFQRHDLAQHFIVSAAIAATDNQFLAKSLGLYKEMMDFDTGSGFSFSDIAADKAGARFGALAVESPQSARRLQQIMRTVRRADFFMPRTQGLPDHLSRTRFESRFGGLKGKEYTRMKALIERRIQMCPLYRYF